MAIKKDSASFRDPSGHVYELDHRILRTVTTKAKSNYEYVRDSAIINQIIETGWVIDTKEINDNLPELRTDNVCYIVEHSKVPYISYPYEWSFEMLKAAALRHLEIQIELLKNN
ncbi:MAG: class I SAM-dependent methyltransferase, partial [Gammaproteobacteria bacterium]|nr:class I SAM-dependent methyltransferase [Gammaproteobacteria bacterium]